MKTQWQKTPSVTTGGKKFFYIHKTTRTLVVWNREFKCWVVWKTTNKFPLTLKFKNENDAMKFADTLPVKST